MKTVSIKSVLSKVSAAPLFLRLSAVFVSTLLSSVLMVKSGHALDDGSIFVDPSDGFLDASKYLSENAYGFLPVPIVITDPAVDGGFGLSGVFFHEDESDRERRLKALQANDENAAKYLFTPNVSVVGAAYTGNDSYFVGGGHLGFFNNGRTRYFGGLGYGSLNLDFYGYGDLTIESPIELNTEAVFVAQNLKFQISKLPVFVGFVQRYTNAELSPTNLNDIDVERFPEALQDDLPALLTREVTTSGFGFTAQFDNRDNFFSPNQGFQYELTHLWFDDSIGSDFHYQLTEFSGLNFFRLTKHWRSNIRIESEYAQTQGILPPFATPSVKLRGIPAGRYQGDAIGVVEWELVYEISPRWEVSAFAGAGRAAEQFSDLSDSPSRVTKGMGFRYMIARRYGFDMGLDIARGPEESVFYIQAGSAW